MGSFWHRHRWSKWGDVFNVGVFINPRQRRTCQGCGRVQERML